MLTDNHRIVHRYCLRFGESSHWKAVSLPLAKSHDVPLASLALYDAANQTDKSVAVGRTKPVEQRECCQSARTSEAALMIFFDRHPPLVTIYPLFSQLIILDPSSQLTCPPSVSRKT
jgi:hypothetical protein